MRRLIITAALVVASLGAPAGTVQVSNFTATGTGAGVDFMGQSASFSVKLMDTGRECSGGTLEALVQTAKGHTTVACWRILGDSVYLTRMHNAYVGDTAVPLSSFTNMEGLRQSILGRANR